jgi:hypothetical protein
MRKPSFMNFQNSGRRDSDPRPNSSPGVTTVYSGCSQSTITFLWATPSFVTSSQVTWNRGVFFFTVHLLSVPLLAM